MRILLVALITGALLAAGAMALASGGPPPVDRGYPPPGVTAIGFATAKVDATNQDSEGAIRRAVEAANAKARPRAFADARRKAEAIGATAGMRLGAVWAVGQDPNVPYYGSGVVQGTFGGNDYCGVRRFRTRARHYVQRHVCQAPKDVTVYLTVTFAQAGLSLSAVRAARASSGSAPSATAASAARQAAASTRPSTGVPALRPSSSASRSCSVPAGGSPRSRRKPSRTAKSSPTSNADVTAAERSRGRDRALHPVQQAPFDVLAHEGVQPELAPEVVVERARGDLRRRRQLGDRDLVERARAELLDRGEGQPSLGGSRNRDPLAHPGHNGVMLSHNPVTARRDAP